MSRLLSYKSITVFILFFFFGGSVMRAQVFDDENGSVEIRGSVKSMGESKLLEGVVISVYKNSFKVSEVKTDKKGKFSVKMQPNSGEYKIVFSYPLHVSMFCTVNSYIPEKSMPFWGGHDFVELPLWPSNTKDVNVYAFKDNPFAKIFWQKKSFGEDLNYFDLFQKRLENIGEMETMRQKEIDEINLKEKIKKDQELKEQQEKDKKEKELKEKEMNLKIQLEKEKNEREKLEREQKEKELKQKQLLEEQKKIEEEIKKTQEDDDVDDQTKLKQEKELKEKLKKKNQAISAQYQSELLSMVAENEKKMKEEKMLKKKLESDANEIVEKMHREEELKKSLDSLNREIDLLKKNKLINQQEKIIQMNGIIKTAAHIEKIIKMETSTGSPDPKKYSSPPSAKVVSETKENAFSTVTTITITKGSVKLVLKKETYIWGTEYFYQDDKEITSAAFISMLKKFKELK
jgi:hypothetical protein